MWEAVVLYVMYVVHASRATPSVHLNLKVEVMQRLSGGEYERALKEVYEGGGFSAGATQIPFIFLVHVQIDTASTSPSHSNLLKTLSLDRTGMRSVETGARRLYSLGKDCRKWLG